MKYFLSHYCDMTAEDNVQNNREQFRICGAIA